MTHRVADISHSASTARAPRLACWQNLLLLALTTWLVVANAYKQTFPSILNSGDFKLIYYPAAQLEREGKSPYTLQRNGEPTYLYSPLLALAIRPLTHLPLERAARVWFFLCAGCALLAVWFHSRASGLGWRHAVEIAVMMLVGFHFAPTVMDLGVGQVQFPLLALFCAACWADVRGRLYTLATLIAAAALIKTWMLGALLYLLLRRRPREFAWGMIVFAASIGVLFSIVGWSQLQPFLSVTRQATHSHWAMSHINQSIIAFARLHFTDNVYVQPVIVSRIAFRAFVAAAYVLVAAALGVAFLRRSDVERARPLALQMVMLALLLASPLYEQLYCVLLLPVFWSLLSGRWGVRFAVMALAMYGIFQRMLGASPPFPPWQHYGLGSFVPSAWGIATAALLLILLAAIRRDQCYTATNSSLHAAAS